MLSEGWIIFLMAAICSNRLKQNSVLNTATKDSIKKIIHLFETFSVQVLTLPHSERVKRTLSSKIHHLNVMVFHPRSQRKRRKQQEIKSSI